jgi:hypothetical protein
MKSVFLSSFVKKKSLLIVSWLIFVLLMTVSCAQDSIFFSISTEIAPNDAKIQDPSEIVVFNNKLFTVTRKDIWSYNGVTWRKMVNQPSPDGDFKHVAATSAALFVQTVDSFELWKTENGITWGEKIPNSSSYSKLQGIYAADNQLFVSGAKWNNNTAENQDYAILWYNGTKLVSLKENMGDKGRLTGAVHIGNFYYLATLDGIYVLQDSSLAAGALNGKDAISGSKDEGSITGLIPDFTQTNLLAVTANGKILTAVANGNATFFTEKRDYSSNFNGALNIAKAESGRYVLMIGGNDRSDNYNYGYRELVLNSDGTFPDTIELGDPGDSIHSSIETSSESNAEYESSLGREVVTSIIQSPLGDKILFASTGSKGLWSYRNEEWNAEE